MYESYVVACKRKDGTLPSLSKVLSSLKKFASEASPDLYNTADEAQRRADFANSQFYGMKPFGVFRVIIEFSEDK